MSSRGNKRHRGRGHTTRPIDKNIVGIALLATTSQVQTILQTQTFPGTVVGIRWDIALRNNHASVNDFVKWAIVIVRDGNSASTLAGGNAAELYQPEQDVLTWGYHWLSDPDSGSGPETAHISGETKTMRKLMGGDQLMFIILGGAVDAVQVRGAVQFFIKT